MTNRHAVTIFSKLSPATLRAIAAPTRYAPRMACATKKSGGGKKSSGGKKSGGKRKR